MTGGEKERVQADVTAQYERFPYPAPVDTLSSGILDGSMGVDGCFSRDYHLYWPAARHRDGLDVLVAGCGSKQAVEMAYGVPGARVVAIDLSATSIAHSRRLAEKHGVGNIEFIQMSLFDVADLGRDFDLIVSTGVIHHLHNPAEGLKALRGVLRRDGSMPLMLYGRYGRDSVYLFQDLFRRLGLTVENVTADDIDKMIDLIRNVPDTHPYHLRKDVYCNFKPEEIVDLYLHPHDIPFTVPAILDLLAESGLVLQHWGRQSSYWPRCTSLVGHPFFERVDALDARTQWTICELYNANINRHFFAACRDDRPLSTYKVEFDGDAFWDYVPQVRWHLRYQPRTDGQPGMEAWTVFASAATPQKITLDATQAFVFSLIDGKQSVRDIVQALLPHGDEATARSYVKSVLRDLWMFDAASFCFSADAVAVPALDIDDAFRRAVEFHQAGQETEAERLYWAIMVESPGLPDVNHNLGIIAVEHGRAEAALPLLRSAIELGNDDKPIYFHSLC
ncbi:MAG: methyltransferase domain-containing protein, partial [Alphaproteobacteria bacterium]|nr:methyltransferase domain-containing protein [Alphaproteobacteria bacterium]